MDIAYNQHQVEVLRVDGDSPTSIGKIERTWAWFYRTFNILDDQGRVLFQLQGSFFGPWTFYIYSNGQVVGHIRKKWSGLAQEIFTDADNFGVDFPVSLDLNAKSLLVAAVFLIDFMYFEDNDANSNSRRGRRGGLRPNMF